ncbi:Transcriptional regulator, TetR family [uncultured Pleomorphomonas sp.]|uniref:Transcriptional regulator, TetR family n=1 Tax=uncultured Pleomorphomonas sp. TaxID=442121 RepID=A0A212LE00_9HYPH|nr:TetR/AcrR family transcriptional regulator [uncultured Pleomorphomonas sp.]SCM75717.1 Transcriptional regulator, TetR family [uncultured Pleomorphomonas sp.]
MIDNAGKPTRKPRADAARNRARLLDAAKAVFAERGGAASLEEVARTAGVGIGTLYRHFPTRDALIEAVYRNESDQLVRAASELAASRPPVEALREWMRLFFNYMSVKHGMMELLDSLADGKSSLYAASGAETKRTIDFLVKNAVSAGEIAVDIEPLDLLRALGGMVQYGGGRDDEEAASHALIDIMIAGLQAKRPR